MEKLICGIWRLHISGAFMIKLIIRDGMQRYLKLANYIKIRHTSRNKVVVLQIRE